VLGLRGEPRHRTAARVQRAALGAAAGGGGPGPRRGSGRSARVVGAPLL